MDVRKTGVCRCVPWIDFDRLLEVPDAFLQRLSGSSVPEVPALEVRLVRAGIERPGIRAPYPFLRCKLHPDLVGDGVGHTAMMDKWMHAYDPFFKKLRKI